MRVFVTGATGFVGSHLVDALVTCGDDVVCLVRDAAKAARVFGGSGPALVAGDLSDSVALRAGCSNVDVIFHVAAVTAAVRPGDFYAVNLEGTRRLLAAAADVAPGLARFVYVSSQAAAGPTRRGEIRTEASPAEPVSAYGESKLAAEELVRASALTWTVVRPPSVYGPRDTEFLRLFKIARWGVLPQFGNADQELSLVHVTDLAKGLLAAVSPGAAHKTYFACHPEIVTARTLARELYAAVRMTRNGQQRRSPVVVPFPAWMTRATLRLTGTVARLTGRPTLLNPDKANELLADAWTCSPQALETDTGWRAEIPFAEGVRDTARWYREHGWL